jgi:hypothetical protein
VVGAVLPDLQKRIVHRKRIWWFLKKSVRLALAGFLKLSVQLQEICYLIETKGVDLPAFNSLGQIV